MRSTEVPLVLRLVHWLLISVLLYLVHQRGDWAGEHRVHSCTKCRHSNHQYPVYQTSNCFI